MRAPACLAVLLLALSLPARGENVESIPRPLPGSWVTDSSRTLQRETLAEVDRLGTAVDDSGQGQLAVVMVNTTGGREPRAFATELFNRWGIGHAGRDDGALLFISLRERAAEIVLGDGVDGPGNQRHSDAVMQQLIVPAFKRGDPDGAVREGALGLRELLAGGEPPGGSSGGMDLSRHSPWLMGSGLGALGLVAAGVRRWLRNRPRVCARCRQPRQRLDEGSDDAHLDGGQRHEEALGSVDYDVWWCEGCEDAQVERYGAWLSSYERCRSCDYRTAQSSSHTRVSATYDHGGIVDVTVRCKHCGHQHAFTRHTPRRTRSSSSSSSGSSSRGFGGGSSSGGGSSGRW